MSIDIPINQIRRRLQFIDLPSSLKTSFFETMIKWSRASGEEWTADRMKSIKQDIINSCANDRWLLETKWVKKKTSYTFSGTLGLIQKLAKQSSNKMKEVMALINLYTIMKPTKLTKTQMLKFESAVTTLADSSSEYYIRNVKVAAKHFSRNRVMHPASSILARPESKPSHEKRIFDEILTYFSSPSGRHVLTEHTEVVYEALCDVLPSARRFSDDKTVGTICVTQNPGYKARFYAAPHIWIQHVMQPLGREIYSIVKEMQWDCTFEQSKAIPFVQSKLSLQEKVYCYDLSSATDRFPVDLQIVALKNILPSKTAKKHIDLFAYLVRQPWNFQDHQIKWLRGQPLGMYPSFGTFTLTHGLMIYALNDFKFDNDFFVLGDDVIILNDELAAKYEKFLIDCDIPFNPSKSIISNRFGEFAGQIIFKDSFLKSRKWNLIKDDSIIQFLQNWGPQYKGLIPRKYASLFDRWSSLPEPFGLGYNPLGLSISDRLDGLEEFLVSEDKTLEYLVDFTHLNTMRIVSSDAKYFYRDLGRILNCSRTLDQRVFIAMERTIPCLKEFFLISGKNLYTVDPDLDLPLSYRSSSSSSTTLSKVMEKIRRLLDSL